MKEFEVDGSTRALVYVVLYAIWAVAVAVSVRGLRRDNAEERALLDGETVPAALDQTESDQTEPDQTDQPDSTRTPTPA